MSTTSDESKQGRSGLGALRAAAVGLGAALLIGGGMATASAAPVTDRVDGPGTIGTLVSNVQWTASPSLTSSGALGFTAGQTANLAFSEPVDVTFKARSLGVRPSTGQAECMVLPAGARVTTLHRLHRYNAATRQLCAVNNNANTFEVYSEVAVTNTQSLAFRGVGAGDYLRSVVDFEVTVDREEPPIPMVAPAFAVAGLVATGALAGVRRMRSGR